MRESDMESEGIRRDAVAIIGMACRFPDADTPLQFWDNLKRGTDSVTRWAGSGAAGAVPARAMLADIDRFDARFFHFTPKQAEISDPQLRLALECSWEAVEDAGYDLERYAGLVGVFMGASLSTYLLRHIGPQFERLAASVGGQQILFANDKDFFPTTISHRLNLKGPSLNISTACSTSLVAVHAAAQALATHQCDMALAGASSVLLPQQPPNYEQGGIYSADGHCRAFDARANGTVGGSGCGFVLLKRIEDALRDGDFIHAVILGGAVNNDGGDKVSFAAPSAAGQRAVIEQALANAGVEAESLSFIEGHGTGTLLGDALELQALSEVFTNENRARASCALGSVKTNIGHLDTAAGIAGLMKVALALRHAQIPPTLHFERPNPQSSLRDGALFVPAAATAWHNGAGRRRAGVSAFGIGGTNAHLVLEEAPPPTNSAAGKPCYVVPMSAQSAAALEAGVRKLAAHLRATPDAALADVAFTLGVGRKAHEVRTAFVCRDRQQLLAQLDARAGEAGAAKIVRPRVAFEFPQIDEWDAALPGMAYELEPGYREALDECATCVATLSPDSGSLVRACARQSLPDDARMRDAMLFSSAYSLARMWMSWGVQPEAVAGSGAGAWVAACLAGVLTLSDALRLAMRMTTLPRVSRGSARIPLLTPLAGEGPGAASDAAYLALKFAPSGNALDVSARQSSIDAWHAGKSPGAEALYRGLAAAWVAGVTVDWNALFANERRRRLPLPTCVFERSRYWLELPDTPVQTVPTATRPGAAVAARADSADIADWGYVPTWKKCARAPTRPTPGSRQWLLLTEPGHFSARFAAHLRRHGHEVIEVFAGARFESLTGEHLRIGPTRPADYDALLAKLVHDQKVPDRIVHLWSLGENSSTASPLQALDAGLDSGLYALLNMAQAMGRANVTKPVRITSLYDGVHDLAGGASLQPQKTALTAALKIIPQEYPTLSCLGLEIEIPAANSVVEERLLDHLMCEADSEAAEVFAAYRQDSRWVQSFESVTLPAVAQRVRLAHDGVYLITGGCGGVGLSLAEYLARHVRCNLALLGRSPFPPAERWASLAADGGEHAAVARRLMALQANGSRVMVVQADVADRAAVARVVSDVERNFGAIRGVIHAAGVPDTFGIIQNRSRDMMEKSMAAKVRGALVLDQLMRGRELDFFVLCSSIGTVLHALKFGEVGYVAANDFLDAFASWRHAREKGLTTTINWTDWLEVGMSARAMQKLADGHSETQRPESQPLPCVHPLLGNRAAAQAPGTFVFTNVLAPEDCWVLDGHRIAGLPVLPGTAYLELVFAAFVESTGMRVAEVKDLSLVAPLIVPDGERRELRVTLRQRPGAFTFAIESRRTGQSQASWQLHASGEVAALADPGERDARTIAFERVRDEGSIRMNTDDGDDANGGMRFGGRWRSIQHIAYARGQGTAELELPEEYRPDLQSYLLHPALLDCAVSFLIPFLLAPGAEPYVPLHYRSIRILRPGPLPGKLWAHARSEQVSVRDGGTITLDAQLVDEGGNVWVEVAGMTARKNTLSAHAPAAAHFVLDVGSVGLLRTLQFVARELPAPGPDEVEVEIEAAALNFKDVLVALGMVPAPGGKGKFGLECAGRVKRLGSNVRTLSVGDEVMGFGGSWVAPSAVFPSAWLARRPARLSTVEAAATPVTFTIAQLALREIGRLGKGESVLIHSAAGGVGLAALQVARAAGAEIHATAGSDAKRAYLRSLGVENLSDSRSPRFGEEVLQRTGGRGVDVVLNSLGTELSRVSLDVLKPQGRFLELGLGNAALESVAQAQHKHFLPIVVDPSDPALERAWKETVQRLSQGSWSALPTKVFALDQLVEAFEFMAAAQHVGKLVISYADWERYAGGMNPRPQTEGEFFKGLMRGMSVRDGTEVFDRILHQDFTRIVVCTEQLQPLIERSNAARTLGVNTFLAQQNLAISARARPDVDTPLLAPGNDTQSRLVQIWKDLLGLHEVGIDDNFFDLGGDSLVAIRLLSRCREEFQVDQTLASLLDHPTITQLAGKIDQLRAATEPPPIAGEASERIVI